MTTEQPTWIRKALSGVLLMIIAGAVSFLLAEVVVRALFKDQIALMPRYHTTGDYGEFQLRRIRPDMTFEHTTPDGTWSFTTNAQGFRNYQDFQYTKPPGKVRVIAMGDSHTQGYECHQDFTYAAVIERYLRNQGIDAEVINTGVSGFSTAEVVALLENEMVRYSPDFIVYGFFANDYEDNLKAGLFQLSDGGALRVERRQHVPGVWVQDIIYALPGIKWLGENSYFYSLLFNSVWDFFKHRLAASAQEQGTTRELAIASKETFSDYEVTLAAALIKRLHEASRQAGAELVIVDIPQAAPEFRFRPSVIEELEDTVRAESELYVDTGMLERYQGVGPLHVPNGGRHITEFTHTILGTRVGEWIHGRLRRGDGAPDSVDSPAAQEQPIEDPILQTPGR